MPSSPGRTCGGGWRANVSGKMTGTLTGGAPHARSPPVRLAPYAHYDTCIFSESSASLGQQHRLTLTYARCTCGAAPLCS
eukprot:333154-Chlamydomonas_euryale.AAC.1